MSEERKAMGAKTCMLVYADGNVGELLKSNPPLDREASVALVKKLFPSEKLQPIEDGNLVDTSPPDDEIRVGCFPGVSIIAAEEFAIEPSLLASKFLAEASGNTVYLHVMHSVVDLLAFGVWTNGKLTRSLGLSLDSGIMEDIGPRLPFEQPYWTGERPLEMDDENFEYPFPFHPLEMGETALLEFFGYQLEGPTYDENDPLFDPETIPLLCFKRVKEKPWWKLW
jgi:hypothetical protein